MNNGYNLYVEFIDGSSRVIRDVYGYKVFNDRYQINIISSPLYININKDQVRIIGKYRDLFEEEHHE